MILEFSSKVFLILSKSKESVIESQPKTNTDKEKIVEKKPVEEKTQQTEVSENNVDSTGNKLTKEQQEFFKDSQIRDKYGVTVCPIQIPIIDGDTVIGFANLIDMKVYTFERSTGEYSSSSILVRSTRYKKYFSPCSFAISSSFFDQKKLEF